MDKETYDRAVKRYNYINPVDGDPRAVLEQIVKAAERADPDDLIPIAVVLIDPLLDVHWQEIGNEFEHAMSESRRLRMAYSATMLDIPDEMRARLDRLVKPDEDIGHQDADHQG